jgi:hypothetical protein
LQVGIFLAGCIARTELVDTREFAMAEDAGRRIIMYEGFQQLVEGMFLLLCTCVGRLTVFIQTSFIDYSKGTTVIASGMDTLNRLWQQGDNCPVITNIVVIATLTVLVNTTFYQLFHTEGLVAPVGHAVNNNVLNGL